MNEVIELSSDDEDNSAADYRIGITDFVNVIVLGPPKSKPRPKFMSWMRGGRMFRRVVNPGAQEETTFRNAFVQSLQVLYGRVPTLPTFHAHEPVELEITFYKKLPLTFFVGDNRQSGLRNPYRLLGTRPMDIKVPDIDNLAKFVFDSLNGVLYADDSQLVKVVLLKTYHMDPPFTGKTLIKFKMSTNTLVL